MLKEYTGGCFSGDRLKWKKKQACKPYFYCTFKKQHQFALQSQCTISELKAIQNEKAKNKQTKEPFIK